MYTRIIDASDITELKGPVLGIFQPNIKKAREWRVTVVDNEVFSAAIYTDSTAKDDWRKHQTTTSVKFVAEKIPEDIASRCISYLGSTSLRYGAFDLVETPEGEVVFLECNPNGQYRWLEASLGLQISPAIARSLVNIAENRS